MESGLALLRSFGVLIISLAMGLSLYVNHVGRAAAISAARAGALAVADSLDVDFNCAFTPAQAEQAEQLAARAVADRLEHLAAVTPTKLSVQIDPACAVVVGVSVAASTWLPLPQPKAVACYHRPADASAAVAALARC